MIRDILAAFRAPELRPLSPTDARLALAALMVRIARSDEDYAPQEAATISALLIDRYGLSPAAAAELRTEAEELEAKAPDTVRFTRVVKEAVPYEHRTEVVEALWTVVLADDQRDDEEDSYMRLVVRLLGVSDRDSGLARRRVQAENS